MMIPDNLRWRRGVFWLAVFATAIIIGSIIFLVSGIYNVAASARHFGATESVINFLLARSVSTYSAGVEAPDEFREGQARLGAVHFRYGCVPCHGSPAEQGSPVVANMYPAPPDLKTAAYEWDREELFWIVRHGLKFSGMPSWAGAGRDDEVWPLVAFLEALPGMSVAEYRRLTGSADNPPHKPLGLMRGPSDLVDYCTACHGGGDRPASDLVPSLEGQKPAYLRRALSEYSRNERQSGFMEPVAVELTESDIDRLVDHFSARRPPAGHTADPQAVARGRRIASQGIADQQVPACLSCHGREEAAQFPRLDGLQAGYIESQLELWRQGGRDQTVYGRIMAAIAPRLTPGQAADVAAYFSAGVEPSPRPEARTP